MNATCPHTPEIYEDYHRGLHWVPGLQEILQQKTVSRHSSAHHGDFPQWYEALLSLPEISVSHRGLNQSRVEAHCSAKLPHRQYRQLRESLLKLSPWRKGPYRIGPVEIDTEWRSDWKWDRLIKDISPLEGKTVLDIGASNGYHCWRIRGEGAKLVLGVEPKILFVMQYHALRFYLQDDGVHILPITFEELPDALAPFCDTIFSMGIFYHRRNPIDHLDRLFTFLHKGGELVLETLIVEGDERNCLLPESRYAGMRNVWFLPSVDLLRRMLSRTGFDNIRLIDIYPTTTSEQRSTEWMPFHSLPEFLNPQNPDLTREGYPAPQRAILIAHKS